MSDREFVTGWFAFFGNSRGMQLFGWMLLARIGGVKTFQELERANAQVFGVSLPRSSLHRVWQDIGRYRTVLEAREGAEVTVEDIVQKARRVSNAGFALG